MTSVLRDWLGGRCGVARRCRDAPAVQRSCNRARSCNRWAAMGNRTTREEKRGSLPNGAESGSERSFCCRGELNVRSGAWMGVGEVGKREISGSEPRLQVTQISLLLQFKRNDHGRALTTSEDAVILQTHASNSHGLAAPRCMVDTVPVETWKGRYLFEDQRRRAMSTSDAAKQAAPLTLPRPQ